MDQIARLVVDASIKEEDYEYIQDYYVVKDKTFDEKLATIREMSNQEYPDFDEIDDYINDNFKVIDFTDTYTFELYN